MNRPPNDNNFEKKGLSPETVRSDLYSTRRAVEAALVAETDLADFSEFFYQNSSDPIEALDENLDELEGQCVLTVAGSGEFAQVFLKHAANVVTVFDVSPPGLFYNELKLEALRHLDYDEYQELFAEGNGLFDKTVYQRVAPYLSAEAKAYFDALIQPSNSLLFTQGLISKRRPTRDGIGYREFMKDQITDEGDYLDLQDLAQGADVYFKLENATHQSRLKEPADIVYLSNIPELMLNYDMVADFIRRGSDRVFFTQDAPVRNEGMAEIVTDGGLKLLEPGDSFKLDGMTARLFAFDPNVQFSAIIEVRFEDNLELRLS